MQALAATAAAAGAASYRRHCHARTLCAKASRSDSAHARLADSQSTTGGPGAQECGEEAGIPQALAATAVAAGAVSYTAAQPAGVKRDVLFVYDLRLPPEFVPAPQARLLAASAVSGTTCCEFV